jgi:hypothetical protein
MSARTTAAAFVAAFAIALQLPAGSAQTQDPAHQHQADAAAPAHDMPGHCQAMMAGQGGMHANTAAARERLSGLVAEMQSASGASKVDAVAAVVAELAALQSAGCCQMMKR